MHYILDPLHLHSLLALKLALGLCMLYDISNPSRASTYCLCSRVCCTLPEPHQPSPLFSRLSATRCCICLLPFHRPPIRHVIPSFDVPFHQPLLRRVIPPFVCSPQRLEAPPPSI